MSEYDDNKIEAGEYCFVSGNITYSHFTSRIDGDELKSLNINRQYPLKPHACVTIKNAVIDISPTRDKYSALDRIVERKFYVPQRDENTLYFTARNYLTEQPFLAIRKGNEIIQITPQGELATNLAVTLVCQTYKSSTHTGLMIVGIICNEEPRFITDTTIEKELQQRGLVFTQLEQQNLITNHHTNTHTKGTEKHESNMPIVL